MVVKTPNIFSITVNDSRLLEQFLSLSGTSLKSFRYFEKRPLSVLNNHVITCLVTDNDIPVGYGHLDKDDDKVWLGIAVAEGFTGQGLGNTIMSFLTSFAKKSLLGKIYLTVDKDNRNAIRLYEKFNFYFVKDINEQSLLMECNLQAC